MSSKRTHTHVHHWALAGQKLKNNNRQSLIRRTMYHKMSMVVINIFSRCGCVGPSGWLVSTVFSLIAVLSSIRQHSTTTTMAGQRWTQQRGLIFDDFVPCWSQTTPGPVQWSTGNAGISKALEKMCYNRGRPLLAVSRAIWFPVRLVRVLVWGDFKI